MKYLLIVLLLTGCAPAAPLAIPAAESLAAPVVGAAVLTFTATQVEDDHGPRACVTHYLECEAAVNNGYVGTRFDEEALRRCRYCHGQCERGARWEDLPQCDYWNWDYSEHD